MPTPFYHLLLAQDLVSSPDLDPASARLLRQNWGAFLLGNIAPDVQVVTQQDRTLTHFFDLPIPPGAEPPWARLLQAHPELTNSLSAGQAAFLAGYICHLAADWHWVLRIFAPVFGPTCRWATFGERLYLHNVLRSYLDRQVVSGILPETARSLSQIQPRAWLPFASDRDLEVWRDVVSPQLAPGAAITTVEVFAARQGISPDAFYKLLDSEEQMGRLVFSRVSTQELRDYRARLLVESAGLVHAFLSGPAVFHKLHLDLSFGHPGS